MQKFTWLEDRIFDGVFGVQAFVNLVGNLFGVRYFSLAWASAIVFLAWQVHGDVQHWQTIETIPSGFFVFTAMLWFMYLLNIVFFAIIIRTAKKNTDSGRRNPWRDHEVMQFVRLIMCLNFSTLIIYFSVPIVVADGLILLTLYLAACDEPPPEAQTYPSM